MTSPSNIMWPGLRCEVYLRTKWQLDPFSRYYSHNRHSGAAVPLCLCGGGTLQSICNTMWHGPTPTSVPSGILIHPAVWPQQIWAKNWGRLCPGLWGRRSWVLIYHNAARAELVPPCQISSLSTPPFGHSTSTLQTDRQTLQENGPIA